MTSPAEDPILLFGAPRSGTTYLQSLLNANPAVFISHETRVFAWLHQALNVLPQDPRYLITYREGFVERLSSVLPETIRDFYRDLAPEALYWGDKNPHYADPHNAGCLEMVAGLFPGSRFIHIIRDGRDVACSLVRKQDSDGNPWVTFETAHTTWTSHVDLGCEFGRAIVPGRYFEVRYEDLIADDLAVADELFRFLGIPLHPAVSAFCQSQQAERTPLSGPTRDLDGGIGVSEWSRFFTLDEQMRSLELLGTHLVRYDYETEKSLGRLVNRTAEALARENPVPQG
jgi:hypothetical protein